MLKKCRRQQDVNAVLSALPRTLEETYDRILAAVNEGCESDVRAVLQWLAFSERPLRLEEVAEIVAFDVPNSTFDVNRRLLNPQEVLTMCSSLVVANETFFLDYSHGRGRKVAITELRLAHFTVKDYLLSPSLRQSVHSYYSIEEKSSSLQIAKSCLIYLNMEPFSSGYHGRAYQDTLLREWPLLDYSAILCGFHIRNIENDLDVSARNLLKKLLATHSLPKGGNFGTLVGTAWFTADPELIQTTAPLYFASSYGLASVVRLLLTDPDGIDLEAKGGRFGSAALEVAAYRGHLDVVRLLLAAGADPNTSNIRDGATPLEWAVHLNFPEIADVLRSYGAKE